MISVFQFFRNLIKPILVLILITAFAVLITNVWVCANVSKCVHQSIDAVQASDIALVLGTSRTVNGRVENPYFKYRMDAAATLFHHRKVKHILVSGDNSSNYYNEPLDMKKALIERGVPDSSITMDFAGLRTFDSVVRSNKVFQQENIIVVSQQFHNYRALFIAKHLGLNAAAYCASGPSFFHYKIRIREWLARTKAVFDLYLLGTKPKYLGRPEPIRV